MHTQRRKPNGQWYQSREERPNFQYKTDSTVFTNITSTRLYYNYLQLCKRISNEQFWQTLPKFNQVFNTIILFCIKIRQFSIENVMMMKLPEMDRRICVGQTIALIRAETESISKACDLSISQSAWQHRAINWVSNSSKKKIKPQSLRSEASVSNVPLTIKIWIDFWLINPHCFADERGGNILQSSLVLLCGGGRNWHLIHIDCILHLCDAIAGPQRRATRVW